MVIDENINELKIKLHLENERYLREHPEIHLLMSAFVKDVLEHKPSSIPDFAGEFFTNPDLEAYVNKNKNVN